MIQSISKFENFNLWYSDDDVIFRRGRMLQSLMNMNLSSGTHHREATNSTAEKSEKCR